MTALLERLSPPIAREMHFLRPPVVTDRNWPPAIDRLSFPHKPAPTGPADHSAEAIDAFIADVLRYYGHKGEELSRITITMNLKPVDPSVKEHPDPLSIVVRRAPGMGGFMARANVSLAFGHGDTIGEAFHDCLEDLSYRAQFLEDNRSRLGPGPEKELRDLDKWRNAGSVDAGAALGR